MSLITDLKSLTGLTSENIANLVGLTRSHITMAEGGRREIPAAALGKIHQLLQLAKAAVKQKKQGPKHPKERAEQHVKQLELQAARSRLRAQQLAGKLDIARRKQETQEVLAAMLQSLDTAWKNAGSEDKLWKAHIQSTLNMAKRKQEKQDLLTLEWRLLQLESQAAAAEQRAGMVRKNFRK